MPDVAEMVKDNPVTNAAGDFLGRKYGPLPLWAWMLIVGGTAFGVRKFLDRNSPASSDATAADNSAEPTLDSYTAGSGDSLRPNFGVGANAGTSSPSDPGTTATDVTPEQWQKSAVAVLTAQGFSGYDAALAIRKYLANQALTAQEKLLVNKAITAVGSPPVAIDAPVAVPVVVPTTPTPTVQKGTKSTITLTRMSDPRRIGDSVGFRVNWFVAGTNAPVDGLAEVMMSTDAGKSFKYAATIPVRKGTFLYERPIGSRAVYRFYVHVSPRDTKYADATSQTLQYDTRSLPTK